jgi:hypothetical protein
MKFSFSFSFSLFIKCETRELPCENCNLLSNLTHADHSGRAGMNRLRSLEHWDREFESNSRHDVCPRLFFVSVVLCVGSGLATG